MELEWTADCQQRAGQTSYVPASDPPSLFHGLGRRCTKWVATSGFECCNRAFSGIILGEATH